MGKLSVMQHHNVLTTPTFLAARAGTREHFSLSQLLARWSRGEPWELVHVRAHQQPAVHAAFVQLAVLGMEAQERTDLPLDEGGWLAALRALTRDHPGDEPWHLVVDDWTRPAFFQSPCAPGAQGEYRDATASAQALDLLITSKNHEEKAFKIRPEAADDVDAWVYALLTLQGFAGRLGPGHECTMRMNKSSASRSQFRITRGRGAGADFVRDVCALAVQLESLYEDAQGGIGTTRALPLLWLETWAAQPLEVGEVHPLCLEVTRRVRLRSLLEGGFEALFAPSQTARVGASELRGNVCDPWTPLVRKGEVHAFTASPHSFHYRKLVPVLFDPAHATLPLLARPTRQERELGAGLTLLAQVLVGGKSKTQGFLRREIAMPTRVAGDYADGSNALAARAAGFSSLAAAAQGKVLRAALIQFIDGTHEPDWTNKDFGKAVEPWVAEMDRCIDAVFFRELFATWGEPPMDDEAARTHWVRVLEALTGNVFARAIEALATRNDSPLFASALARRVLDAAMHRHLDAPAMAERVHGSDKRSAGGKATARSKASTTIATGGAA